MQKAASALTTGKVRSKCLWLSSGSKWGTSRLEGRKGAPPQPSAEGDTWVPMA